DLEIREAGFSGSGSAATTAARTNGDRSFLRFSGKARRENSRRIEKPGPFATERTERAGPERNFAALQKFTRSLDLVRAHDRFRRGTPGIALSPHHTGRAHDRRQDMPRRIDGCAIPQRLIV